MAKITKVDIPKNGDDDDNDAESINTGKKIAREDESHDSIDDDSSDDSSYDESHDSFIEETPEIQNLLLDSSANFQDGVKKAKGIEEFSNSIEDQAPEFQKVLFESLSIFYSDSQDGFKNSSTDVKAKGIEESFNSMEDERPEFQKVLFESSANFSSHSQDGFKNSTEVKAKSIEESCDSMFQNFLNDFISFLSQDDADDHLNKIQDLKRKPLEKSCSIENVPDFQDDNSKKSLDLKGKSIDKSCCIKNIPESVFFRGRRIEKGEPSCTICVICDDRKPLGSTSMKSIKNCDHHFCEDCISKYVGEKIQENPREVLCPESRCNEILDIDLIESLVPDEHFLHHLRQVYAELKPLGKKETLVCPYNSCRKTFLGEQSKDPIITCTNCWNIICSECWVPYHIGKNCRDYMKSLWDNDDEISEEYDFLPDRLFSFADAFDTVD